MTRPRTAYVFLGPSLEATEARRECDEAILLPPVRRGDVYRLVSEDSPTHIAIVDGMFDRAPAVLHKEILFALSRGVHVLGAASMGALRAAELWPFGMEGVGKVFDRYRSGAWDRDDEVAVVHGPAETGFRSTSVALANLRLGLEAAAQRRLISPETTHKLVAAAEGLFYPDRSWNVLFKLGTAHDVPAAELSALRSYVASERPDAKRDDALALLRRVRALLAGDEPAPRPTLEFDFEPTTYWRRFVSETRPIGHGGPNGAVRVSHKRLRRHMSTQPEGAERLRGAVLLHLLALDSRRRTSRVGSEQIQDALKRFRRRHGLLSPQQTQDWLAAQELAEDELVVLLELELALSAVLSDAGPAVWGLLPLELKRRGEFARATDAVARKSRILDARGVTSLSLEDVGLSYAELMDWYQTAQGSIEGSLDTYAKEMGFESSREFVVELLLDYANSAREGTLGGGIAG